MFGLFGRGRQGRDPFNLRSVSLGGEYQSQPLPGAGPSMSAPGGGLETLYPALAQTAGAVNLGGPTAKTGLSMPRFAGNIGKFLKGPGGYALAGIPIAMTAIDELGRPDGDLQQNLGGAAGSVVGGVGGGLLGTAGAMALGATTGGLGAPIGFALGSMLGTSLGSSAGRSIGGLFSESELDKQIKDQRKLARAAYQMAIERTAAMDPTVQLQQARAMGLLQKQAYLQAEINGLDRFQQAMMAAPMQQFDPAPIAQMFR